MVIIIVAYMWISPHFGTKLLFRKLSSHCRKAGFRPSVLCSQRGCVCSGQPGVRDRRTDRY